MLHRQTAPGFLSMKEEEKKKELIIESNSSIIIQVFLPNHSISCSAAQKHILCGLGGFFSGATALKVSLVE